MKALSIKQPWAWLIVNGFKTIENRNWRTKRRGRFYVHAGKRLDEEAVVALKQAYPKLPWPALFEVGGIVGEACVVDVVTESASEWFYGKYGFVLSDAKPLPFIPYKGQLGFF
jgi:ASCH domain